MTATRVEIRQGAYYDSIVLMHLQAALARLDGILEAGVVMGGPSNKELLAESGFATPEIAAARPDDLIIAVRGADEAAAGAALAQVDGLLAQRRATLRQDYRPQSLDTAAHMLPDARFVLISVAGRYAAGVARQALALNKHVFLFSDNVPVAEEIALKRDAAERGLLVMGPDCGTAIVNGVGLGFANKVRRGPIGVVAAAGTGLQQVTSRIHQLGGGVTHGLGTGGRDLSEQVGAVTFRQAIDLLSRDPLVSVIVLVSKPPAPSVAEDVLELAENAGKPVVVAFVGRPVTCTTRGNLHFAASLDHAAALAVAQSFQPDDLRISGVGGNEGEAGLAAREKPGFFGASADLAAREKPGFLGASADLAAREKPGFLGASADLAAREKPGFLGASADLAAREKPGFFAPGQCYLRGLFSGGTLAYEAQAILKDYLPGVWANAPLDKAWQLPNALHSQEHTIVDLGEDEFTVGRLHPMLDNELRIKRLLQEAADPQVAVILLDVVLGYGSHPDPASELAPAIERAIGIARDAGRRLDVLVVLTGTDEDPQDMAGQRERLTGAGAAVDTRNEATVRRAGELVRALAPRPTPPALRTVSLEALQEPLAALNVGLESFAENLAAQDAVVLHVDWRPPAGGNERLMAILARMK